MPWSRLQERIVSGIEAALLGKKTVEQTLADMDREIDTILVRGRKAHVTAGTGPQGQPQP